MTGDLQDQLGKVLDQYDARRRDEAARVQRAKDEDARFLERFAALRRDVVQPVFEQAGAILAARGHRFEISQEEFAADAAGKVTEASISLRVEPAGMEGASAAHRRTLTVSTRHYNKTAYVDAGAAMDSGGLQGSKGAYPLERVDKALVEELLVKFVAGIVS